MDYITTTGLRTQSSELIKTLNKGRQVTLIHRSIIVGVIKQEERKNKTFDIAKFRKLVGQPKNRDTLTHKQRDTIYRQHLEEKYGKNIS